MDWIASHVRQAYAFKVLGVQSVYIVAVSVGLQVTLEAGPCIYLIYKCIYHGLQEGNVDCQNVEK